MENENLSAMFAGSMMLVSLVVLVLAAFFIVCSWKVYTKAGKPGWAAIVPIYNLVVYFQVAGMSGWWTLSVLAAFIPIVGALFYAGVCVYATHRIAKNFGHGVGYTLGLIFLSFIFWPMLAFGSSKYAPVAKAA